MLHTNTKHFPTQSGYTLPFRWKLLLNWLPHSYQNGDIDSGSTQDQCFAVANCTEYIWVDKMSPVFFITLPIVLTLLIIFTYSICKEFCIINFSFAIHVFNSKQRISHAFFLKSILTCKTYIYFIWTWNTKKSEIFSKYKKKNCSI